MESTINFFAPNCTEYNVFICSGKRKNRRERGAYMHLANSYLNAATIFGGHWNTCTVSKTYGTEWKISGRRKGNPKSHTYVKDELGNELLIVKG